MPAFNFSRGGDDDKNDDDGTVQVLICSANLGNAPPDEISFRHWVPDDGHCSSVVVAQRQRPGQPAPQPQRYPIVSDNDNDNCCESERMLLELEDDNGDDDDSTVTNNGNPPRRQFDIIAFGLQESTFDLPKQTQKQESIELILEDGGGGGTALGVGALDAEECGGAASPSTTSLNNGGAAATTSGPKANAPTTTTTTTAPTKVLQKKLSAIQNLATNRDYTKRTSDLSIPDAWRGGTQVLHDMMEQRLPSYERIVYVFFLGTQRICKPPKESAFLLIPSPDDDP
jgi:hypothetical protein